MLSSVVLSGNLGTVFRDIICDIAKHLGPTSFLPAGINKCMKKFAKNQDQCFKYVSKRKLQNLIIGKTQNILEVVLKPTRRISTRISKTELAEFNAQIRIVEHLLEKQKKGQVRGKRIVFPTLCSDWHNKGEPACTTEISRNRIAFSSTRC